MNTFTPTDLDKTLERLQTLIDAQNDYIRELKRSNETLRQEAIQLNQQLAKEIKARKDIKPTPDYEFCIRNKLTGATQKLNIVGETP